ncbi:hypothetical protein ACQRKX_000387 [Enterobacter cloacae]
MSRAEVAIIDLLRKNEEHYVFNSLTIKAISEENNASVWLSDDATLIDELMSDVKVNKINVTRTKLYFWLYSTLHLAIILLKLPKTISSVFILSATPLQYAILSVLSLIIRPKIFLFMHGELGYLKTPFGLGQKLGRLFISLGLSFGNVKFICISSSIHESLSQLFANRKFYYVQHPIFTHEKSPKGTKDINFGSFGIQSENKGSDRIYELENYVSSMHLKCLRLITVGVSDGGFIYDKSTNVQHLCRGYLKESLISKDEFYSNVQKIDVALIFSSQATISDTTYDLVSSGVFADCIAFDMPVIAMRNKQLSHYFERYGQFGFLCDSVKEMADAVQEITQNRELLDKFKAVLSKVREDFKFENYKVRIAEIMRNE